MPVILRLGHAGFFRSPGGVAFFDGELTFRCVWMERDFSYFPAPEFLYSQVGPEVTAVGSDHLSDGLVQFPRARPWNEVFRSEPQLTWYGEQPEAASTIDCGADGTTSVVNTEVHASSIYSSLNLTRQWRSEPIPDHPYARVFSYAQLLFLCLLAEPEYTMPLRSIYVWIQAHYQKAATGEKASENSVRHNLSLNKGFIKGPKQDPTENGRKNPNWSLTWEAIRDGCVESTTRYRKKPANKPTETSIVTQPSPARQASGSKGGIATRDNARRRSSARKAREAVAPYQVRNRASTEPRSDTMVLSTQELAMIPLPPVMPTFQEESENSTTGLGGKLPLLHDSLSFLPTPPTADSPSPLAEQNNQPIPPPEFTHFPELGPSSLDGLRLEHLPLTPPVLRAQLMNTTSFPSILRAEDEEPQYISQQQSPLNELLPPELSSPILQQLPLQSSPELQTMPLPPPVLPQYVTLAELENNSGLMLPEELPADPNAPSAVLGLPEEDTEIFGGLPELPWLQALDLQEDLSGGWANAGAGANPGP